MKVLLVRLRLIGDVVFTTPAIRALRRRFPDAQLTYLVEPEAAPVVEANPHLTSVIVVTRDDRPQWRSDLALASRLRAERFDVAIDFHGGPRASLLTWASRARRRIGYTVAGRSWMYTDRIRRDRTLRPRHSVLNQWDLLAPLGISAPTPAEDPTEMAIDRMVATATQERLRKAGLAAHHVLIVVHVSAGNPFRRWPLGAFVDLVVQLTREPTRRVVITSGPSDRGAAADVARCVRETLGTGRAEAILDCGELDLKELRLVMDRAALFVGGDSGPLHVASTTRVPIVGLYGPTLPARSEPWRNPALVSEVVETTGLPCRPCDQRRCEPGDFRCLTRVTAEMVAAAAERAIGRSAGHALAGDQVR